MQKTELEKMVARHEGYSPNVYRCPAGKLTIGYGYNLQAGMPEDEAHLLMRHRLNKIDGELDGRLPWYDSLPTAIKKGSIQNSEKIVRLRKINVSITGCS